MAPISGFIIICLLITLGYLVGLLVFLTDHEENRCDMTFMFEYPQFVRIHSKSDAYYKKYGLYAYSEGHFTHRARQMYFDGIPVLFIPGNAGSFKQVRSFASVALRKSLDSRPGYHFDFFTLDLNNELSGLNGALLNEQMQYVNHSVARILELYQNLKQPPKSIVIIGHSMGGIIARGLLAASPESSNIFPVIITLASPHTRPPVAFDINMVDYYYKMQKVTSVNSTIIALSGGYNDFMVMPFITNAKDFENLHAVTTSVPLVWLPVDHLCILWCKQLVLAVTRALFDLVDLKTKQITLDPQYHRQVFQHHLVQHSGIKARNAHQYKLPADLSKNTNHWIENLQKQYTISLLKGVKEMQWHMIRLFSQPSHEFLTVLAINLEVTDWVFACPAVHVQEQSRVCLEGMHLTHLSEIAPSAKYKKRILRVNLHELKRNYTEATHVIMRVLPTREPVVLHVDIHGSDERKVEVNLPRWWSLRQQSIIAETTEKVLHYELVIPQLQHIMQSYKLYVEPLKCTSNVHHATASLSVPWANHGVHKYITETERNPLDVRLYTSRPHGLNSSFVTIKLTLDPDCIYSVSINNSFLGMLGQITRTYSTLMIANAVAVVLLAFRNQLVSIDTTGSCCIFFNAIKHGVKPYYILTMVKLASRGLSWKGFSRFLPVPDWQLIAEEGNDFFLLPLLLYMCSVGIVWIAALGIASSLIFCESTFHKGVTKFLARTITGAVKFSDWLIGGFHKLPCVVATVLVVLSITTCGGLALCLGCVFYFLKLTQMSQDYVEGLVVKVVKYLARKFKRRVLSERTNENTTQESMSGENRLTEDNLNDRGLTRTEDEIQPQQDEKEESKKEIETSVVNDERDKSESKSLKKNEEKKDDIIEAVPECSSKNVITAENNESEQLTEDSNAKKPEEPEERDTETANRVKPAAHSQIFFHFTIFLLWVIVAGLSLPSVLTWAHNFKYNTALQPDPAFLPGIILSLCAIPLWQLDLPKPNKYLYMQLGQILNILAAISLIYAPLSVYRLVYIITAAVVLITLHQLLAPTRAEIAEDAPETVDTPNPETLYERVKAKWE